MNKQIAGLLSLVAAVFWASASFAQDLSRLAPPVPAVHRPPTQAQDLCDRMARYAAVHPDVPLGVRTPERSADFNPRDPLQVVALRRWAEQSLVENGVTQPAAHAQALRLPIATIVARLRAAWNVPADRSLRFNWSLAFEREPWCNATTVNGREPAASQAVSGSLQASFCIIPTGSSRLGYRAPHECAIPLVLGGPPQPETINVTTGRSVDVRVDDAFGYGSMGLSAGSSSYSP